VKRPTVKKKPQSLQADRDNTLYYVGLWKESIQGVLNSSRHHSNAHSTQRGALERSPRNCAQGVPQGGMLKARGWSVGRKQNSQQTLCRVGARARALARVCAEAVDVSSCRARAEFVQGGVLGY